MGLICMSMALDGYNTSKHPIVKRVPTDKNIVDLQKENEELLRFSKDSTKTFEKLLKEKRFFESEKSKLLSKINELELEVKNFAKAKEVIEPCQKGIILLILGGFAWYYTHAYIENGVTFIAKSSLTFLAKRSKIQHNVSKLQDEALNFSKFKKSSIVLDDMLSRQKLSQDKEGLGFSKNEKITSVCLKCDLLPDDWIMDSGCTKHMTRNRRLFTSCKAYDGGHVVFRSNLKGKVVGGGNISHDFITITNVEHVNGLAFNLISIGSQENANNRTRNEVSTTRVLEFLHLDLFGPSSIQSYRGNFYTLMIVDDHSNYTWAVFIESKDDVLDKFKILCKKLEKLHDCSIVTNRHSEFDKLQFGSFCDQHGMPYNLLGLFIS
ncbi:retrovirus-related pol polyprotein from transposon TNT 1-94 [Tanacetum coccineum]